MTVTLELTSAQEHAIKSDAEREGLMVQQYILRRLMSPLPARPTSAEMEAQVAEGFAASGMTEDELEEYVVQSVKQIRAENR